MSDFTRIALHPLGQTLLVERGARLQDVLFEQGVEFPCGGRGRCKGCRVKVLEGHWPLTVEDQRLLAPGEIAAGWRLACRATAGQDLKIELAQWETAILADHGALSDFAPQPGLGVVVDLGTTTVVAQLLELQTGQVLAVRVALNGQAQYGADIMSRVEFALRGQGQATLQTAIRKQIGQMIAALLAAAGDRAQDLTQVVVVGNTVMHHLFCGLGVEPLAYHPFDPPRDGLQVFAPEQLGWTWLGAAAPVRFLPCLGGFVGSDILAGILATRLHENPQLAGLVDLGTNGEIVIGNCERLLCASTAAGPAFEGARISMGMRAATGAIAAVAVREDQLFCHTLGNAAPRGICGSGLVDAVAAGLELGWITASGRLTNGQAIPLGGPVTLTQGDVRELQLAKGAIAAGLRLLLEQWGARPEDLTRLYLAGAFGNYINRRSAQRIGLLPYGPDKVASAGNTALLGAKLALFRLPETHGAYPALQNKIQHVPLNENSRFQDIYAAEMGFPEGPFGAAEGAGPGQAES